MNIEEFLDSKLTKIGEMPNGDYIYWITEKNVNKLKEMLKDKKRGQNTPLKV